MLGSLHKDEVTGIVGYNPEYCVGCRYCQMACPFNVPKFEFGKAVPNIVKCELCRHRVKDAATAVDGFTRYPKGQGPACCEVCPRQAVIYGTRDELLADARRRIAQNPGRYHEDRIYGETEPAARRSSTWRTCRSRRLGLAGARAIGRLPRPRGTSRTGSTGSCRSLRRWRCTPCSRE